MNMVGATFFNVEGKTIRKPRVCITIAERDQAREMARWQQEMVVEQGGARMFDGSSSRRRRRTTGGGRDATAVLH